MTSVVLKAVFKDIKKIDADAVVVGLYEDARPLKGLAGELDWLLCGSLSSLVIGNKLKGSLGEVALLSSRDKIQAKKIFVVGLGPKRSFSAESGRYAARAAALSAAGAGAARTAIEYFHASDSGHDACIRAMREGLKDGASGRSMDISLIAPDADAYEKISSLFR